MQSDFYKDILFDIYFYFDSFEEIVYIDKIVLYLLIIVHVSVLFNLKRFDKIWDIIDEKFFKV